MNGYNTRATLRGDLNQEWQQFEAAYLELSVTVNPESKDNTLQQQSIALLLGEVRAASQEAGKQDLQLLTKILESVHQLKEDPNNKAYQSNYENLIARLESKNRWRKVKAAATIVFAALCIGALATVAVLTHFAAAPVVFYGIKLSILHIITSMSVLSVAGAALSMVGMFSVSAASKNGRITESFKNSRPEVIAKAQPV